MYKNWFFVFLFIISFHPLGFAADKTAESRPGKAIVLELSNLNPASVDYIKRGIDYAQTQHANAIILQLNSKGGLENSMRQINEAIITSPIPIIVYIAPTKAQAANQATFITYASHLAAMAPDALIGPAFSHPSFVTPNEQKKMEDASAYMKSLAQLRGRNADWAEISIHKGTSLSAKEAKQLKVIDEIADDYSILLKNMDGHHVLTQGIPEKITTKNLTIELVKPHWRYEFLLFFTQPNIVYLLILMTFYGFFLEIFHPKLIIPGLLGIISLILFLYVVQFIPINYTGLSLTILGMIFMIFDINISIHGVLGLGGIISFILGPMMLFNMNEPNYHLTLSFILIMGIFTITFFLIMLTLAVKSAKKIRK